MVLDHEMLLEMYRRMVRIREFETAASDLFRRGQVKGTVHPYSGQEASGVGVCMALRQDDLIAARCTSLRLIPAAWAPWPWSAPASRWQWAPR